jgi:hypothetical protein
MTDFIIHDCLFKEICKIVVPLLGSATDEMKISAFVGA